MKLSPLRRLRAVFLPNWTDDWRKMVPTFATLTGLHIGCGPDRYPPLLRLDINHAVKPDVVWDLNQTPYPFADASFDLIIAVNILEHLQDTFGVMGELHRLLRPNGKVCILCPHFSSASAHIDPTHVRSLSAQSFDYFIDGTDYCRQYGYYVSYRYKLAVRRVSLAGIWGWIPGLSTLISRRPKLWENHLCYLVRGAGVYFELVKPDRP